MTKENPMLSSEWRKQIFLNLLLTVLGSDIKISFSCVWMWLTSHEEEEAGHILHEASVPAAAEHANDPTEQDDGHCHAHETCCHSPQVWEQTQRESGETSARHTF